MYDINRPIRYPDALPRLVSKAVSIS